MYFGFDTVHCFKNLTNHLRDDFVKLPCQSVIDVSDFQAALDFRGQNESSLGLSAISLLHLYYVMSNLFCLLGLVVVGFPSRLVVCFVCSVDSICDGLQLCI